MLFKAIILLFVTSCIQAAVITRPNDIHDHTHENEVYDKPLPSSWYQDPDHPVHSLFRRAPIDGTFPAVGTPEWSAGFPPMGATPNTALTPPAWTAALNAAVAAGKIPNIPNSPYPQGVDPSSPQVCSGSAWCHIPGDIFDGPDGVWASSFDDGPYPQTTTLVQYLQTQGVTTTHFMIGGNILLNPNAFLAAFNADHDIAVHTWSHPYTTRLSNEQVLAEFGWCMQLIYNSTGGRVPRYWRPPYGDNDQRTRAIAVEVFGLQAVYWNHDSNDFAYGSQDQVVGSLNGIISTSAKSPGAITLQHEISDPDVNGFIAVFPSIATNGWKFQSLARALNDGQSYQNANSSIGDVSKKGILVKEPTSIPSSTATPIAASTSSMPSATQSTSSSSSLLLSHESPSSCLFLSSVLVAVVFLIF